MMKILARVMASVGFCFVLIGGSAMDSRSIMVPVAIILCGIVMMWNGISLEEQYA